MFLRTVNLTVYQGLPFSKALRFDETDPASALHTRALSITGRVLKAQIDGRPKAKAYEIEINEDPPTPGTYVFLLVYAGVEYELEIEVEAGELAKDLQAKLIVAIKDLHLGLSACAEKCSNAHEIIVAAPWPGLEWTLALTSQPDDDVEVGLVQSNTPLAVFGASSVVDVDQLVVTLVLSAAKTGAIPAAGDGPYRWRLTAVAVANNVENPDDALMLAHGLLTVGRA